MLKTIVGDKREDVPAVDSVDSAIPVEQPPAKKARGNVAAARIGSSAASKKRKTAT